MKKKVERRKIELQAYIDYINDHILFNGQTYLNQAGSNKYVQECDDIQLRLDELNTL